MKNSLPHAQKKCWAELNTHTESIKKYKLNNLLLCKFFSVPNT